MKHLYQKYLDIEVGDLIHVSYVPKPRRIVRISNPHYVNACGSGDIFIYKYPRCTLRLNDGGWINQVCFDSELGIYRTNRDVIRLEKPTKRPQMIVDMFDSFLSPVDTPYVFQEGVDYNAFFVWKCTDCNHDFESDVSRKPSFDRYIVSCVLCGKYINRRVFYMDGESFRYSSEPNAWGSSPETMHWSTISEHQHVKDKVEAQ